MTGRQPAPDAEERALRLRAAIALPRGGAALMLGFPGLSIAVDGGLWIDPDPMAAVLGRLAARRAAVLVSLVCRSEVPAGALAALKAAAGHHGIRLVRLPIRDYAAPGRRWVSAMAGFGHRLDAITDRGGAVALCCHYGAGRSGTVAAHLLIRQGVPPALAIRRVRAGFAKAIESEAQRRWLDGGARPRLTPSGSARSS